MMRRRPRVRRQRGHRSHRSHRPTGKLLLLLLLLLLSSSLLLVLRHGYLPKIIVGKEDQVAINERKLKATGMELCPKFMDE